ncbi:MAG: hypothetical protein K9W43_13915 [Candidatus Thorarchaeota archaeon]|nr:hypothetical protein [Candidatus Thorarchaeota archaeon]
MGENMVSQNGWAEERLDEVRARAIITEIFQEAKQTPPSVIEFVRTSDIQSRPQISLDEGVLHVEAFAEYELKKLVGQLILRQRWSLISWFLVNHGRLFIIINSFLLGGVLAIVAIIAQMNQSIQTEMITWAVLVTTLLMQIIIYIGPIKHMRLKRKLAIDMRHLSCLTEYDAHDLKMDQIILVITFMMPISWAIFILTVLNNTISYSDASYDIVFGVPLALSVLGVFLWIPTALLCSRTDLCFGKRRDDAKRGARYHTSEYLERAFNEVIDKLELREGLYSAYDEFDSINVRYRDIKYPQCREIYFYVNKRTLMIKASDISEEAAKRFGIARLVADSIQPDSDEILSQRSRPIFNFMFVISMALAGAIMKYSISQDAMVITSIIAAVIFTWSWLIEWRYNSEMREKMAMALKRTGLFSEESAKLHTRLVKIISARFDLSILIGSLFILFGMVWLLSVTNGV